MGEVCPRVGYSKMLLRLRLSLHVSMQRNTHLSGCCRIGDAENFMKTHAEPTIRDSTRQLLALAPWYGSAPG